MYSSPSLHLIILCLLVTMFPFAAASYSHVSLSCPLKHLCEVARSGGVLTGLEELKAVMLLGRGELFHTLLRVGAPLLDGPPIVSTSNDGYTNCYVIVVELTMLQLLHSSNVSYVNSLGFYSSCLVVIYIYT